MLRFSNVPVGLNESPVFHELFVASTDGNWRGIDVLSDKVFGSVGIDPRLPEYIPGALPTELPSLGDQFGLPLIVT